VDYTLFTTPDRDSRSEIVNIRVTPKEKEQVRLMARHERVSISRFVLALIKNEYDAQIANGLWDEDEMPF
jgi:uncharacterized protein (DUF1778 family)